MVERIVDINVKNENGSYDNLIIRNARTARYASDDHSKGTIEERISSLEHKESSVSLTNGSAFGVVSGGSCLCVRDLNLIRLTFDMSFNDDVSIVDMSKFLSGHDMSIGYLKDSRFCPNDTINGTLTIDVTYTLSINNATRRISDKMAIDISVDSVGNISISSSTYAHGWLAYYKTIEFSKGTANIHFVK